MTDEQKPPVELTPIEAQIGFFARMVQLVDAVSEYHEAVYMFEPGLDSYAELEAKQIAIARAFLRAAGIPDGPEALTWNEPTEPAEPGAPSSRYQKVPIPPDLRWEVFRRDNFTCKECGAQAHLHADHIVPESKGGPTTLENLQTLCKACNRKKGARG